MSTPQVEHYWRLRGEGLSQARAAGGAGFSTATAKRLEGQPSNGDDYRAARASVKVTGPVPLDDICDEAKAALADRSGFLWCKRYFGIELSPWQQDSWRQMEDAWDSRDREFMLENAPPGGGKSTKLVAFFAKQVARNRSVRLLFMSRALSLAERNSLRLRRALERATPMVGAAAALAGDFGRFKPSVSGELWRRDEWVVEQMDGSPIEEKEPTCSAFGFDSEWIGNRLDGIGGDDMDTIRSIRNLEIVEGRREVFDNELEPRLEPGDVHPTGGGFFFMAQQRLGPTDFSAHALAKVILPDDDGGDEDPQGTPQYQHVIYKAHYEEVCKHLPDHERRRLHASGAPAWPEGCLLDPRRLPWRDIRKAMNNRQRFQVVYQQEDAYAEDVLVQPVWVDGGAGANGVEYLGCWDKDRDLCQLPPGLTPPWLSYITVDPSPTRMWAVQWWVWHAGTDQYFLMNSHRGRMESPDFLDSSPTLGFTGMAEDWWQLAQPVAPVTHLIVEINAAQRFMLQHEFFHRWMRERSVHVVPHSTARNKADELLGVQMLGPLYEHGKVRLPGKGQGRLAGRFLVDEVTRYPHGTTDDQVLCQWFGTHNRERLWTPPVDPNLHQRRPTWLRGKRAA